MTPHFTPDAALRPNGRVSPDHAVQAAQASLVLLHELEASLEATQKAVLARDLAGLEQGTLEQIRLEQAFREQWTQCRTRLPSNAGTSRSPVLLEPQLAAELRAAGTRVLHLGRVQAALLVRAQRSLRMIASLAGRADLGYGPSPARILSCPPALPATPGDESLCRV